VVEGVSAYENFIRTLNAVIAKYAQMTKSKGSNKGGEQQEQNNSSSNQPTGGIQ